MTQMLFRDDSYLRSTPATVIGITPEGGIILDRTVFYATSGGQPGDSGRLERSSGPTISIAAAVHPEGDKTTIMHVPPEGHGLPAVGERVTAVIDWERRHRLMRMHTALHLLTVVLPYPITGAAVGEDKGRVDFNLPEVVAPEEIERKLNALVAADYAVSAEWITDEEMAANPRLVKSMNVRPPMGQGRVRLIRIGEIDLQPCGGTHVRSTAEIGPLKVGKVEKKGAINRRINLSFADHSTGGA